MRKRWWLCHATDFQSLMYPCFIVCRILGLLPYKINTSTFETSRPRYILSSVIVGVFCIIISVLIYDIITGKRFYGEVTWHVHATIYQTLNIFVVITAHVLSGPRMRLLQTIWEISTKLSPESYRKLSRLIHTTDILSTIFRLVQMYINCSNLLKRFDYFSILIVVLTVYSALFLLQIIMMYINCVFILKACFEEINNNLMHMQRRLINNMKPSVSKFIWQVQRNRIVLVELKILEKRHLIISDAVQMLNIIFSLQLLAAVVMCFTFMVFYLYFYAIRWQDGIFISVNEYFFTPSIIYNGLIITLLIWSCETGKNQALEIRTTIHDLLNSTSDEKIKYELQLFSLQTLHRENMFSAKGLNIDATLLTAMVGGIITYLIILIQFLNMSHSCDIEPGINIK